jgi:hypothetical protein
VSGSSDTGPPGRDISVAAAIGVRLVRHRIAPWSRYLGGHRYWCQALRTPDPPGRDISVAAAIGVGSAAPGRPLAAISRWPSLLVSAESDTGSAITCLHQARVRRETHAEVSTGAGATSCRHEWQHSTRLSQPRMSQLSQLSHDCVQSRWCAAVCRPRSVGTRDSSHVSQMSQAAGHRGPGSARGCDGHWRAIDADNLSSRANQFGRQKANETATAADIQHAHAWRNACSLQIHARTRSDEPVLLKQRDAKGNVLA